RGYHSERGLITQKQDHWFSRQLDSGKTPLRSYLLSLSDDERAAVAASAIPGLPGLVDLARRGDGEGVNPFAKTEGGSAEGYRRLGERALETLCGNFITRGSVDEAVAAMDVLATVRRPLAAETIGLIRARCDRDQSKHEISQALLNLALARC